ncbi:MAG: TylF/MycF family methyltransferase [Clostridium sp.]|uniref:TylF/MycF/NovP-related O-methyltransferase n=1 Tax=Clostridium sp. TaxID=1506 RepID=UPI0025BD8A0D|nr:TylF/MycF/NovP-related O-methyltransferase [Clostridium sp.]MCH3964314.1 TylF/MycF family methyltransferase [Clostridium sp.]MCI1715489.1 TylF/MycF family methyltransferase [Clostridium sp.]MCI1799719.1 TylF/MycF family methyltransferase [Clostridium sp.]MCI1813673.1 TylF/MycF family methyltransferase [Clostridium sp.]MCI1870532.1 TylF/MycF family methyltransferase [Clostridium sp.]
MITLPDKNKSFEYENNFYLTCDISRIAKPLIHYELYKRILNLPGAVIECGLFKGISLKRFICYRDLLENKNSRKIIGFDIFGKFPTTLFQDDKGKREKFIREAGEEGISKNQLVEVLSKNEIYNNIELIEGDINETVPKFVRNHSELKIALLNLDTDIYEPAVTVLENLYPRIVKNGILILDDYGVFPGETKAVDEFFKDKNVIIEKSKLNSTPSFIIKP